MIKINTENFREIESVRKVLNRNSRIKKYNT